MNTAVASRQTETPGVKHIAIVPGDRISTSRADIYGYEELRVAVTKRYRGNDIFKTDLEDVLELGLPLLKDAVEEVVRRTVERTGDDRHVILTPDELRARAQRNEAEGVLGALIVLLKKGKTHESTVRMCVRQQVSMRKIDRDPDRLGSRLIRKLVDDKFISLHVGGHAGNSWSWVPSKDLPKEDYLEFYKACTSGA